MIGTGTAKQEPTTVMMMTPTMAADTIIAAPFIQANRHLKAVRAINHTKAHTNQGLAADQKAVSGDKHEYVSSGKTALF